MSVEKPEGERLAKFLAHAGVASRRAAERLVAAGEVTLNGRVIADPAHPVTDRDIVEWKGTLIRPAGKERRYLMLHKPLGVLSTMKPGEESGPCLADIIQTPGRVHPVGRLDKDSSGLLLMTDDGDLTLKLTHPSHEIEKEYLVKLNRQLLPRDVQRIAKGVIVDDRAVFVKELGIAHGGRVRIVIIEGRNRIVRRLFGALNINVLELKRVRIGSVSLGRLAIGRWRKLTSTEIDSLKGTRSERNTNNPSLHPVVRPPRAGRAS